MRSINDLFQRPAVRAALAAFHERRETILSQIIAIQQIPAPTFEEARRAAFIEERFQALGLADVSRDALNNVYGKLAGASPGRPPVVISAHLDTVFPIETNLAVRHDGRVVYGPGLGDNSTGVGGLLQVAEMIRERVLPHESDIYFVANVGEEGLGDLCGMRAVVDKFGGEATYIVVEGGLFGKLIHQAVGVRRYHIEVTAPGGHSWGGFGAASAIHVLGHLIVDIDGLSVPTIPKTTYNVGIIQGGTSINTIANSAHLWLDLRSEGPAALEQLVKSTEEILRLRSRKYVLEGHGVEIKMEQVGNRPAGGIDRQSPVVALADAALRAVGREDVDYIVSSTDANVPLSRGYQAVCLGLTHSGNSHRPDEFIDTTHLPAGLGQLMLVALAAAG
ncbi:MAG: M20/M25/M40 family metallo-hydrolase [Anaerolineales bacterium]|uniref:M20/M25/M40 family metallo-hydrolase n=1 Tax=Promineifilum sp. TaxID=2664178 RepID=UPI001E018F07|nr:M20/M25/M40 family metallo-hydrolase [Anaerolineales bacterium]MCB8935776.1 M20/M25/M40 family metallo-hydrolase [Promineifilum sp.]MCO5179577.1 M20/M25/M40 family metallo-hydrolase [Promineifilum sp.]